MQADTGLVYTPPTWREILKSFEPIKDNRKKMALEPYPDEKVLAAFAKLAYSDCTGELDLPKGWQLLTTARNNSWTNGYFGCAFCNLSQQQVVLAHRGTNPKTLGALWVDGKGVYCNNYTNHMSSSVCFADDVKETIIETNQRHGSRFVMSFTGHSLGAWLASVTTLTVKHLKRDGTGFCRIASPGEGLYAHTLALDSPGVKDMLIKIYRDYDERYNRSICTKYLDITTIFATPNPVNCTGFHVGDIYQLGNVNTHSIDDFIEAFRKGTTKLAVQNWPQGLVERKHHDELEMFFNYYISQLGYEHVPLASPSASHQNTHQYDSMHLEETPTSWKYRTKVSMESSCHLGVFSAEESNFLRNWSFFQSNALIKLTEIEKFTNRQRLQKLDIPIFQMDAQGNTITCETKECLRKVIRQTKQLLRWFRAEIMNALARQNRQIKLGPLYMAGQAYLRTLPDILNCEDTLGLALFLDSSKRVLQIESTDTKFETARLHNIFRQIKNTSFNTVYLKENHYTFLCCKYMASIAKDVDFENLSKSDITIDNLLVLEDTLSNENSLQNSDLLRKILKNLETCSHKKLVIITQQPIYSQLFMDYNFISVTKPFKAFELRDLTPTSREEILARDSIALGEEILSLNTLLGDDCTSSDGQIQNKINQLILPILKDLAMDDQYIAKIPNKLPRLFELDALHSKGSKRVDKTKIVALLETTRADGPLLVISDPKQLSQDYLGEVAKDVRGRIFICEENGQDLFLEKCREEPGRIIYLLYLDAEGLNLNEVYNSGLYMPRKFHTRFIIQSVDAFVRNSGTKDIFIFNDAEDKLKLISSFELSKDAEEIFVSKDHFQIRNHSHEMNFGNKNKEDIFNEHYFVKLEIGGIPCLVWQYSHGSLDGLHPFITRDYGNPIEEGPFSNIKKKLTIIADDPGMGKTTSLTRMSELIQDSWVLRIDHRHPSSAIDKLPSILNLQSVTKCLIHASGLPTNDGLLRSLLQHCLESDSSRQVCIFVDAFDEITEERIKVNVIELLKYLKNTTKCKAVVTTRVHPQEGLENELSEFSTVLEKITEREQDYYMMKYWLPHLALELPGYGKSEKRKLRLFAKELREEMERVLGEDVASFMGIPLQIRMLAEVFLQQAILSVVSPEQEQNLCKVTNLFDLYKQFIEVKTKIYFDQKNKNNMVLPPTFRTQLVTAIMEKHYFLAFQALNSKFAAEYFANTLISNQELKDISGLGLIRANRNGSFPFIHRTIEEYFCADFFVQWLRQERQTKGNITLVNDELCNLLLSPNYFIIRKFIETQLDISPPVPSDILENNAIFYQSWYEHRQQFFHEHYKTPLHIAVEEQNWQIFAVLLSGPSCRTSEEAYVSFIAARDKGGRTALNIALENGYLNIVKKITDYAESCSYESLLKLMLATFLNMGSDTDDNLFGEYFSLFQPLTSVNRALARTEQIRIQITSLTTAVRDNDYRIVRKILGGMESHTERAHLLIAIDIQGDTAINLAASNKDNTLFKLFAKEGICMCFDKFELNPLHCAARKGHISIVKYLLNQSKETYDNIKTIKIDEYPDEEATVFQNAGLYKMCSSIKSHNGSTALHFAAEGGHYEIVKELLENGADIHTRYNYGWTALMQAVRDGHFEVVKLLLLNGADIHTRDNNGLTALMVAASKGYLEVVDILLLNGAEIHTTTNYCWTALMHAASKGNREVVNLLLLNGADIDKKDNIGWSALILAISKGHLEVVDLLLANGADIHARTDNGWTTLIAAASKGHREVVNILLLYEADIHTTANDGWTALMHAASKGHLEVVDLLLLNGADIDTRTDNGWTTLIAAASKGHREVVDLLLLNGADIHARTDNGWTTLIAAASKGHREVVNILLLYEADIHTTANDGWTALMHAASKGHLEVVDLLLLNGADIHARTDNGWTTLIAAASKGHREVVDLLLLNGADIHARTDNGWTTLIAAASKGHREVVDLLLLNGADIHARTDNGWTTLIAAASKGHREVVNILLLYGADIRTTANDGWTALMHAASKGHLEVVDLLLLNGADINIRDNIGWSALILAAYEGYLKIVKLLLLNGADVRTRNNEGWASLNCAAANDHLEVVELLLLNGADLNSRDEDGDSALLQAAANGHPEMVVLLLQCGVDVNSQRDDGRTALSWAALKGHVNVVEVLLQHNANVSCQDNDGKTALSWAEENGDREVVDILSSHLDVNPMSVNVPNL